MLAIILADSHSDELEPLASRFPQALLPLVGKPVLGHLLEQLRRCDITNVLVISPGHQQQLETSIDTGPLLGMYIRFSSALPDLRRLKEKTLIIGTRHLVDVNWRHMADETSENNGPQCSNMLTTSVGAVGVLLPPGASDLVPDTWDDIEKMALPRLSIDACMTVTVDSLKSYLDSNFRLLNEDFEFFFPAGRKNMNGLYLSPKSSVKSNSLQGHNAYIGSHSRVDAAASLHGNVVIGDDVLIDRGADLSDTIILDRTYIGAMTRYTNAIVHQDLLIKVDSGISVKIDDPVLVSANR
jgi:NDP-sugar pyrophosphorylase family protein